MKKAPSGFDIENVNALRVKVIGSCLVRMLPAQLGRFRDFVTNDMSVWRETFHQFVDRVHSSQ